MKRIAAQVFFALPLAVLPLAGCKEPASGNAPVAGLLTPGRDVAIKVLRMSAAVDARALSDDQFYVVTLTFTNDLGYSVMPRIDHFVIEDNQRRRFLGADSGSPALIGINNTRALLRQGESHDYTVGFRVPQNTTGTLYYDATF